jgi:hypothetical protein
LLLKHTADRNCKAFETPELLLIISKLLQQHQVETPRKPRTPAKAAQLRLQTLLPLAPAGASSERTPPAREYRARLIS